MHIPGDFIVLPHWETRTRTRTRTMTWIPTQLYYPDIQPTSPYPILIMLTAWLGNDNYQYLNHWVDSTRPVGSKSPDLLKSYTHFGLWVWSIWIDDYVDDEFRYFAEIDEAVVESDDVEMVMLLTMLRWWCYWRCCLYWWSWLCYLSWWSCWWWKQI